MTTGIIIAVLLVGVLVILLRIRKKEKQGGG